MPTLRYSFQKENQENTLEIKYKFSFTVPPIKDLIVRLNGNLIGSIARNEELIEGREYILDNGSVLKIQAVVNLGFRLVVLMDGQPVPGSQSHPMQRLKESFTAFFIIGGYYIALSAAALIWNVDYLKEAGFNFASALWGSMFVILGLFVLRRSLIALTIGVCLLILETVTFLLEPNSNFSTAVLGLSLRAVLIIFMIRGFSAIRELKSSKTSA